MKSIINGDNVVAKQIKARLRSARSLAIQSIESGVGPVIERRYSVSVSRPGCYRSFSELRCDPDQFSPALIASFEKEAGTRGVEVGRTFTVNLSAPLIAPVIVSQVGDSFFELATLEGHPESGTIKFGLTDGELQEFFIHSVARSGFPIFDFFYLKLGVMKKIQTQMWVEFCRNFAKVSDGGEAAGAKIEVLTTYSDSSRQDEREQFIV